VSRVIELRATWALRPHPANAGVPPLPGDERQALKADLARRGILEPLQVSTTGVVLDGCTRLALGRELGIETLPVRVLKVADEREHVLLSALRRQHLDETQRTLLAVELLDLEAEREQAQARRRQNLRQNAAEGATLPPRGKTRARIAELAGTGERTAQKVLSVREGSPELYRELKTGATNADKAFRQLQRQRRYAEIGEAGPMPEGPFQLLYADPPWQLGSPTSASAPEQHYPTMALAEIKSLQPPAAEESILFLWAVNCLLPEALEVMDAWGFSYRSNAVWDKQAQGQGQWFLQQHELLLVGIKGGFPTPEPKRRSSSVICSPKRRHSQKPDCVYELIERIYPQVSKLELFARNPRPGWSAWGNQAPR
jgi:N6-adenosine-specific RNA methylase IME4/ParB-like chromosome segregation protein Spo0J